MNILAHISATPKFKAQPVTMEVFEIERAAACMQRQFCAWKVGTSTRMWPSDIM
jgi:hypothetical protein